ncbi:MAG TPA: class I adenylate-forming enzyme family protein, partial [Acidimicrobiia bacterium]
MSEDEHPTHSGTTNATTTSASRSLPDVFRTVAAEHSDRLAYQDRSRSVSYGQLDQESNRVANALLRIVDDRPLALVAPVSIASLTLIFGALKAGRLVAPLDPRWPVEQWLEVVRRLDGRLVVPDAETRDALPTAVAATTLVASDLLLDDDTSPPTVAIDPDEP